MSTIGKWSGLALGVAALTRSKKRGEIESSDQKESRKSASDVYNVPVKERSATGVWGRLVALVRR